MDAQKQTAASENSLAGSGHTVTGTRHTALLRLLLLLNTVLLAAGCCCHRQRHSMCLLHTHLNPLLTNDWDTASILSPATSAHSTYTQLYSSQTRHSHTFREQIRTTRQCPCQHIAYRAVCMHKLKHLSHHERALAHHHEHTYQTQCRI